MMLGMSLPGLIKHKQRQLQELLKMPLRTSQHGYANLKHIN